MRVRLTFEVSAGQEISAACREAQRIADAVDECVMFVFNGVECVAVPGGDPGALVERQQAAQTRKPRVYSGKAEV